MSNLTDRLKHDFEDPEFRHVYADESLNTYIATQIKVLREQRGWTQADLANRADMRQSRISVMEDIDYSAWSINTLRRLAQAFDLRLAVRFESFGTLLPEIDGFSREELERPSFDEDPAFRDVQVSTTALHGSVVSNFEQGNTAIHSWGAGGTANVSGTIGSEGVGSATVSTANTARAARSSFAA